LALGEDDGEGTDVCGERVQLGAPAQDRFELELLWFVEPVGAGGDPSGHLADRWRRGGDRVWDPHGPQIGAEGAVAAAVAHRGYLFQQPGGVAFAFFPASVQVGLVVIDHAGFGGPLAPQQFVGGLCADVADNGAVAHAELAGDRADAVPGVLQFVDPRVLGAGAIGEPGRAFRFWCGRCRLRLRVLVTQAGAVPGDRAFHRFGQVVPQMPPVGALERIRCAVAGAV
jgi:hypothetical protein